MKRAGLQCIAFFFLTVFAQSAVALSTSQTATQNSNHSIDKSDLNDTEIDKTATDDANAPSNSATQGNVLPAEGGKTVVIDADLPKLLVKVTTDKSEAFAHEQILVSVRVGAPASAFAINGGMFQVAQAQVTALNKSSSNEKFEQLNYQFHEFVYAMFAEKPGELVFPAITYSATLPVAKRRNTNENKQSDARKIKTNPRLSASSKPLNIKINEPPQAPTAPQNAEKHTDINANTIWLPAIDVKLSSSWEGALSAKEDINSNTIIPAGTPIKRRVLIEIQGQHAERLPLHAQKVQEPQRQYADQPVIERDLTPSSLNGVKLLSTTIIAPDIGDFLLPALSINWWDIKKKTWRTSTLEPETIEVVANGATQYSTQDNAEGTALKQEPRSVIQRIQATSPRIVVALALLIIGLTTLCILHWQHRKPFLHNRSKRAQLPLKKPANEVQAWRALRKSMKDKNLQHTRQALLNWFNQRWPKRNIRTLEQVKAHWPETSHALSALEESLYSRDGNDLKQMNDRVKDLRKQLAKLRKDTVIGTQSSSPRAPQTTLRSLYQNNQNFQ